MNRPRKFDLMQPAEAAKVSQFMEEAQVGRWRLKRFTVTQREFDFKSTVGALNLKNDHPTRVQMQLARVVPPGDYLSLQRRMTVAEARIELDEYIQTSEDATGVKMTDADVQEVLNGFALGKDAWVPVMSDTPAEINEHGDAMDRAVGRVLVSGLGMGVLVSALLANPMVTHIDVVEIDPDVIDLTAPYYADEPRVTIHRGDAATIEWPADARWDYAWHDIWSNISDLNLDEETAEHGIAYDTLFRKYDHRAMAQGAWAFPEAVRMQRLKFEEREALRARHQRYVEADHDGRVALLIEDKIRECTVGLPSGAPIPDEVMDFYLGQGMATWAEETITLAENDGRFSRTSGSRFDSWAREEDGLGRPNDFITR